MTEDLTALLDGSLWRSGNRQEEGFQLVHVHRWPLPADIRIVRNALRYRFVKDAAHAQQWVNAPPGIELLTGFLRLAEADAAAILGYAKTWGVLSLCDTHKLPWSHPQFTDQSAPCRFAATEPLEMWRYYAKVLRAALGEALELRKSHALEERSKRSRQAVDLFLARFDRVVRRFGCLRPMLVVEAGRFEIKLSGSGGYATSLPAALTTQLLALVSGAMGRLATCAGCGQLYAPRRQPRAGQDSFCDKCGVHAAWRAAQQRRREKSTSRIYAPRRERSDD